MCERDAFAGTELLARAVSINPSTGRRDLGERDIRRAVGEDRAGAGRGGPVGEPHPWRARRANVPGGLLAASCRRVKRGECTPGTSLPGNYRRGAEST